MPRLLAILLLATYADALITFDNSQLIDRFDITTSEGVGFDCPGAGCTLYTTYQPAGQNVGIFDDATLLATMKTIYSMSGGYLVGYHLKAGTNYRVKPAQPDIQPNSLSDFTLYIVADIAGTGAVVDFGKSSNTIQLDASGKKTVTILTTRFGVTLSEFSGNTAPKIYSTGFDSISTCSPVYTARSVQNAAKSVIGVYSAISTIDFGSTEDANQYKVMTLDNDDKTPTLAAGQSLIVMSLAYNGCANPKDAKYRTHEIEHHIRTHSDNRIDVNFNDLSISVDNVLTLSAIGPSSVNNTVIKGSKPQSYCFDGSTTEVDIVWQPTNSDDYFHAQIDVDGGAVSRDNGGTEDEPGQPVWLYVVLGILFIILLVASSYGAYKGYLCMRQKSQEDAHIIYPPDEGQYEEIEWKNTTYPTSLTPTLPAQPIPQTAPATIIANTPANPAQSGPLTPVVANHTSPTNPTPARTVTPSPQPRAVMPLAALEFSSKFLNDFHVIKILGEGGFGCVFEATNKYDNGVQIKRALGEVRAMALLEHPNIVRYNSTWMEQPPAGFQHDVDAEMIRMLGMTRRSLMNYEDDSVFIYIQMQLCNYSLSDWLKDNQELSSRPLSRMKLWFKQIVSAVDFIHENNIIHRDLKPSNVLFTDGNTLKICDLGIATERSDEDESETAITRTAIGTALYMSPEQIFNNLRSGEPFEFIEDARTAEFIKMLTQLDLKHRPTCKEMLDHLFLA